MIQRIRYPDGTNHDIDRGPGPVGRMAIPGRGRNLGGAMVSQTIETPAKTDRDRQTTERIKARTRKVHELRAQGHSEREVAAALGISRHAVRDDIERWVP